MYIRKSILMVLLGVLLAQSIPALANNPYRSTRVVWRDKASRSTGLYSTKSRYVDDAISFGYNALYYFGDVDNMGIMLNGGVNVENFSKTGSFTFGYYKALGNQCALRFNLSLGTLNGNNTKMLQKLTPPRDDYRQFKSAFLQPALGVEWYPVRNCGFYIYAGVALTASYIYDFQFYYNNPSAGRELYYGKTVGFLPTLQLGLGYSWNLSSQWMFSIELMGNEGIIDTPYANLDAFPNAASQNNLGKDLATSWGTWKDANGKKHIHWNDGWFQLGIRFTYRFRNCEKCRILDNYAGIRPSRKP